MSKPFCTEGLPTVPGDSTKRPYLIGITGVQGAGKSAVGDALRDNGVFVIDTDHLTHELLNAPCEAYREILERFGADLVNEEGGPIDRKMLRERALNTAENKAELERIMLPRINQLLERKILEQPSDSIVAVQVPLLHEVRLKEHFDEVWCIVVDPEVHLERLMKRDNLTREEALAVLAKQLPQSEKLRLSDYSVDNSGGIDETKTAVTNLLAEADARRRGASTNPKAPSDEVELPPADDQGDGDETPAPADDEGSGDELPPGDDRGNGDQTPAPGGDGSGDGGTDNGGTDPDEEHHKDVLRQFGHLGTAEALERLGHLSGTRHKEATATMTLEVDTRDGTNDGDPNRSRKLTVGVTMSVENKPGKPADQSCPCGCGKTCRVTCACSTACGCSCTKPAPLPPPTPKPCPGDGNGGNGGDKGHNRNWLGLGALIALLAFLAFLAFLAWKQQSDTHNITIINKPPCCTTVVEPPKPPVEPPVVPVDPPTPPASPCKPGTIQTLTEVPGYGFRFVHNHVREKVTKWEEQYASDCAPALRGFDASGRILVYQVYDAKHWHQHQFVISYFPDGSIQVDRFEGRLNSFTGRTIYRYDHNGNVERAESFDSQQRRVYTVNIRRALSGEVTTLYVSEFDRATGIELKRTVVDGPDGCQSFLESNFYVYRWFLRK